MAKDLTFQNGQKEELLPQIAERLLQIRRKLFDDNNREMSSKIGEDERVVSAICTGKRSAGLSTILKLLDAVPDIDANWLLFGRGSMIRREVASVNVSDSPQTTVNSTISAPVELVTLLNSQQETIKTLTDLLTSCSK
jgi:predicted transcriptional regulator